MSSLARGRGLEGLELWLAGLFSAAELAAADLLLQLSVAGAGGDDDTGDSSSATTYSSRRSASPCLEDLTAEEEMEEPERVVEETALPAASTELDRRVRKRYRRLSELYAATSPVTSASASASASGAKKLKRKRNHRDDGFGSPSSSESSAGEATRYGGDY